MTRLIALLPSSGVLFQVQGVCCVGGSGTVLPVPLPGKEDERRRTRVAPSLFATRTSGDGRPAGASFRELPLRTPNGRTPRIRAD